MNKDKILEANYGNLQMKLMLVNHAFVTGQKDKLIRKFSPGETILSLPTHERLYTKILEENSIKSGQDLTKHVSFIPLNEIFKKATKNGNFKNLLIIRYGGIGDLIALSSIIDYFEDANCHFITQERYFDVFDWFVKKPKLYKTDDIIFRSFKRSDANFRFNTWARFEGEGLIENGHSRNWYELFFAFIDEHMPDIDFLRPQLITERINGNPSNISKDKPSLLICNKATAMMRSIELEEIYNALPGYIKNEFNIYSHSGNFTKPIPGIIEIKANSLAQFLLDCYDADNVITIDTGALHFREGINKSAIGIYNSFTTDARTKYYQYTKSFDIKSDCELQPCFIHEKPNLKHCPKGNKEMFGAPCLNSEFNVNLQDRLKEIFNKYI